MKIRCNETNKAPFLLVPKHGKPVYALALVNRVTSTDLYAETIEQVSAEEAVELSRAMDVEMTLADALVEMHNDDQDGTEAQKNAWTPDRTPLNGRSCRMLGRSPTEAECPPLKIRKLDIAGGD